MDGEVQIGKPPPRLKPHPLYRSLIGDREGTTKKLCDKDFAERSGELSGAICLKALFLLGNDPVIPSNCSEKFFGAVRAIFGLCASFFLPDLILTLMLNLNHSLQMQLRASRSFHPTFHHKCLPSALSPSRTL